MTVSISIDRDGCIECGACADSCGEIFEVPNGEKARIIANYQAGSEAEGSVGDDLYDCAASAADACPVEVITVSR